MNYKTCFITTLIILAIFVLAFIIIPISFDYKMGFVNGVNFSLEEPYYLISVIVAIIVAVFTYKIYSDNLG